MTEAATAVDPLYVEARRALLDALAELALHGAAVIVAGAQAVYLRTGAAEIAVAPYTSDGDLTLDPALLGDAPLLAAAMQAAGFDLSRGSDGHVEPGVWVTRARVGGVEAIIPVDLIVPEGAAPEGGRRAARLEPHGRRAARRAVGLEAALIDRSPMTVSSLDPADDRSIRAEVAGSAALLVAKAHKLHDRVDSGRVDRLDDKDAADVVRLMQTTSPSEIGTTFKRLFEDPVAGPPSRAALVYLRDLFGRRGAVGTEMAARALRGGIPERRVEAICTSYVSGLTAKAPSAGPGSPS